MTRIRTAAVTVLVLGATTVIDIAPSTAETYRPWCAQYSGRGGGRNCSFTSFEQCMMTAGPGTGASCVQNPWYLWYGKGGPATAGRGGKSRYR
jgi:Protein of unknown function (DUF3551)